MNKPVLYLFFFIFSTISFGQVNLVPNGSFEEYWGCPQTNDLNDGQFENCKYWWKPTLGTSDYFNSCNSNSVSIPKNFWGFQEAYDGNGYVGIVLFSWEINTSNYLGNEYIQSKLNKTLKKCSEYYFEMQVNFANQSRYAFSKIGVLFTKDSLIKNTLEPINSSPQIINNQGFLNDTIHWIKISGNFVSNGTERFLTIGYFQDDVINDTLFFQNPLFFNNEGYGYYYIDDVKLIEIGEINNCSFTIPNVFTPNNDGDNDFLEFISPSEGLFTVLNRWGQIVFRESGSKIIWDGNKLSEGIYYYTFVSQTSTKTGFIQLIR